MTTKFVDIIKRDSEGNELVNVSLKDKDIENINKMGVAIKNTIKDVSDLTTKESKDVENLEERINNDKKLNDKVHNKHSLEISKNSAEIENVKSNVESNKKDINELKNNVDNLELKVDNNISALSNRVEEIYNNGIDEIQQKRIEALEKVDINELDRIQDAADRLDELESKGLKNYDAEINSLTERIYEVENSDFATNTSLNSTKEELQTKDSELEESLNSVKADVETNKTNIENLSLKSNKLDSDIESSNIRINSLELKADKINANVNKNSNDLNSIANRVQSLENAGAKNHDEDINRIDASIALLQEKDGSLSDSINQMQSEYSDFKSEVESTVQTNKDSILELQGNVLSLQAKDTELSNSIQDNTSRIESLEAQHSVDVTEIENTVKRLNSEDELHNALLSEHSNSIQKHENDIKSIKNNVETISSDLDSVEDRVQVLENKKPKNYDAEIEGISAEILDLNLKSNSTKVELSEVKKTTERNALNIASNTSAIEEISNKLDSNIESTSSELKSLNSKIENLDSETQGNIAALQSKDSELKDLIDSNNNNINNNIGIINSDISDLKSKVNVNKGKIDDIETDMNNYKVDNNLRVETLESTSDTHATKISDLESAVQNNTSDIAVNKGLLDTLDTAKTRMQSEIDANTSKITENYNELKDLIENTSNVTGEVKDAFEVLDSRVQSNVAKIQHNSNLIHNLENEDKKNKDAITANLNSINSLSETVATNVEAINSDIADLNTKVDTLDSESKEEIEKVHNELTSNVTSINNTISNVKNEIDNNINTKLTEIESDISNLETEVNENINSKVQDINDEIVEINAKVLRNTNKTDENANSIEGLEARTTALESLNAKNYDSDITRLDDKDLELEERILVNNNNIVTVSADVKALKEGYTEAQQDLHNTVEDFTTRLETVEETVKDSVQTSKEFNADTISRIEANNAELNEIKLSSDSRFAKLGSRVQDLEDLNAKNYDSDITRLDETDTTLANNIEDLRLEVSSNKNSIEERVDNVHSELRDYDSVMQTRITDLALNTNDKIDSLNSKVDSNKSETDSSLTRLSNRIEEIYNNGIDEVQQRRLEALENVDIEELAKIKDAANRIEYLESKGLKNYDEDIKTLNTRNAEHDLRLSELEEVDKAHDADLVDLKPRVQDLETITEAHKDELDELNTHLSNVESTMNNNEVQMDARVDALEIAKEINDTDITNIKDKDSEQDLRIDNLEAKGQNDINDINSKFETFKENQEAQNKDVNENLDRIENNLYNNNTSIINRINNLDTDLNSDISALNTKVENYNESLSEQISVNANNIDILTEKVAQQKNIELVSERPENPDGQTLYIITGAEPDNEDSSMFDIADVNSKINALQTADETFDNRVSLLETMNSVHQADIADIKNLNTNQNKEIQTLHNVDDSIINNIQTIESHLNNVDAKGSELTNRVSEHDQHLDTVDSRLDDHDQHLSNHDSHLDTVDSRLNVHDTRLNDIDSHINTIDTKNLDQELNLKDHQSRIQALETDKISKDTYNSQNSAKNDEQDARLTAIEAYDVQNSKDIKELRDYNTANDSKIAQLDEIDTAYNVRLNSLEGDNTTNKANIKDLQGLTEIHSTEIENLHKKDSKLDSKDADLQSQMNARTTKDLEQDLEIRKAKARLNSHDEEIKNLHDYDDELTAKVTALEGKMPDGSEAYTLAELTTHVISLHEKDDLLDIEDEDHGTRIKDLEDLTASHTTYMTGLREDQTSWNNRQDNRLKTLETSNNSHNNRLVSLETSQELQNSQISSLNSNLSQHSATLANHGDRLNELETATIDAIQAELTSLHDFDKDLKKADTKMRQDWEDNNDQVQARFTSLQETDATQNSRLRELERVTESNAAVMKTVDNRLQTLETSKTNLEAKDNELAKRIQGVEQFSSNHNSRLQELENLEHVDYKTRLQTLESVNSNQETRLDNYTNANSTLQTRIQTLNDVVASNKTEYTNLVNSARTNAETLSTNALNSAKSYTDNLKSVVEDRDSRQDSRIELIENELTYIRENINKSSDIVENAQIASLDVVEEIPSNPDANTLYVVNSESDVEEDNTPTVFDLTQLNAEINSLKTADTTLSTRISDVEAQIDELDNYNVQEKLDELTNKDSYLEDQFHSWDEQQLEQNARLTALEQKDSELDAYNEKQDSDFYEYKVIQDERDDAQEARLDAIEAHNEQQDNTIAKNLSDLQRDLKAEETKAENDNAQLHTEIIDEIEAKGVPGQVISLMKNGTETVISAKNIVTLHSFVIDDEEVENAKENAFDMSSVFNTWRRITHSTAGQNLTNNTNHQNVAKAWSFDPVSLNISCAVNESVFGAFVSNEDYFKYDITIEATGADDDNDLFAIVCGFMTDDNGVQHTLSLVRTKLREDHTRYLYAFVYDYNLSTEICLVNGDNLVTPMSAGWRNNTVKIRIERDFDTINCYSSEVNGAIKGGSKITYVRPKAKGTLTDAAYANISKMLDEGSPIGFGVLSQCGSFRIVDQSGIFEDPRIYNVPKDEVLQKINNVWTNVGQISRTFEDRTLVYNDETGKLFWIQNGRVTILADKHAEKTTIGNLDYRISNIETQLGESTTRFSVVRELPENPDPNVLYMIIGESVETDTGIPELNLGELRESIKQLKSADLEHNTLISEVQNRSETNSTDISNLRDRVLELENSTVTKAIEDDVEELRNQNNLINNNIININNNISKNKLELDSINANIQELKDNVPDDIQTEITDLKVENLALRNKVQNLENKLAQLESKIENLGVLNNIEFVHEIPSDADENKLYVVLK